MSNRQQAARIDMRGSGGLCICHIDSPGKSQASSIYILQKLTLRFSIRSFSGFHHAPNLKEKKPKKEKKLNYHSCCLSMCPGASGAFGMSLSDALRSSQLMPVMGVGPSSNKNIPDTRNALLRKQFANLFSQKQERTIFDVRIFLSGKILPHYCQGIYFILL